MSLSGDSLLWAILASVAAHGGEADPILLHWIKDRLDQLIGGAGPWVVVGILGLLIVAVPVAVIAFYLVQQRRSQV